MCDHRRHTDKYCTPIKAFLGKKYNTLFVINHLLTVCKLPVPFALTELL